jgi:hypothetical protein
MTWHERIHKARRRGKFTTRDRIDAKSWFSCACGEQDKRIPRTIDGWPKDYGLFVLGGQFFSAVKNDDFDAAEHILAKIEVRAAQLLTAQESGDDSIASQTKEQ